MEEMLKKVIANLDEINYAACRPLWDELAFKIGIEQQEADMPNADR